MILVDKEIKTFVENGRKDGIDNNQTAIIGGEEDNITNIGYDLRAEGFIVDNKIKSECCINPGETVFMKSFERILFDNKTCGRIYTKNSRIRMGLTAEAPLYQPGHSTNIFVRLTNISDKVIMLKSGEKYVILTFEQLSKEPKEPYNGTFQNEEEYLKLAGYKAAYDEQTKAVDEKINDIKELERSIYTNVVTILTIFIAIFSIINVNVSLISDCADKFTFLTLNLSILGAISFLSVLMDEILNRGREKKHWLWLIPSICFITLAFLIIFQK